jgi:hypothetical protein
MITVFKRIEITKKKNETKNKVKTGIQLNNRFFSFLMQGYKITKNYVLLLMKQVYCLKNFTSTKALFYSKIGKFF